QEDLSTGRLAGIKADPHKALVRFDLSVIQGNDLVVVPGTPVVRMVPTTRRGALIERGLIGVQLTWIHRGAVDTAGPRRLYIPSGILHARDQLLQDRGPWKLCRVSGFVDRV